MNYLGIFAACIGVPLLIVSMAYLAWLAAEGDREREDAARDQHPAGREQ